MKKIAIALLACCVSMTAFSANKTTTQNSKNTVSKVYPIDSFDPMKFSASNIPEFTKRYSAESAVFLKKGEFETTDKYDARIAQGFKTKSLDSSKIYAFQLDSISIKYNPDNTRYEIRTIDSPDVGQLFPSLRIATTRIAIEGVNSNSNSNTSEDTLRIGKINRTSGSYNASNAYGKKANVIRIHGSDFYIKSSNSFNNVNDNALVFSTEIDNAKKNSSCKKQVYVFAKLNGNIYEEDYYSAYAALEVPKINLPLDIQIKKQTIPMDILGMVLKCSTGPVISTLTVEPLNKIDSENTDTIEGLSKRIFTE